MKRQTYFLLNQLLLFGLLLSAYSTTAQKQIVIKPGPLNGKFCYLNSYNFNGNYQTESLIAAAWTYGGEFGIGRSFFSFDLPAIPASCSNLHATLQLFFDPTSAHVGHGGDNICKLERIVSSWDEFNIDWSHQPQVDSSIRVFLPTSITSNQSYPEIDVTSLVTKMYELPQTSFGFRLSLLTENLYRSMILSSCNHSDESLRPTLIITYDSCSFPDNQFSFSTHGAFVQFTYTDSTTSEWHWNFGDQSSSNLQNPSHTYTRPGTYIVTLTAINQCGRTTMSDTLTVCAPPVSDFVYRADNQVVRFINMSQNADSWYWSFGNGFFSNLENPVYHFLEPGTYETCLLASNSCGSDIRCNRIVIEAYTNPQSTGTETEIETTPNPTSGELKVTSSPNHTILKIEISTTSGRIVQTLFPEAVASVSINISNLDSGVYIVKTITTQGEYSKLIIKE